jgi:hypothetical protein
MSHWQPAPFLANLNKQQWHFFSQHADKPAVCLCIFAVVPRLFLRGISLLGRQREDSDSKLVWANSSQDLIENNQHKNRAGGVAQVQVPESPKKNRASTLSR